MHGQLRRHFRFARLREFTTIYRATFRLYGFSIHHYGLINRHSSVLIIGGTCDGSTSALIAKYTNNKWESVGYLQHPREGHRAILNDDRIYVVGGYGTKSEYVCVNEIST